LELHHRLSQWTAALASAALLMIPLLQAFGVPVEYTPQQLNVIQSVLAVVVLILSLLLGSEGFAVKAEKMHRCGTELNQLAQEMSVYSDEDKDAYSLYIQKYHTILQKYENHKQIDYRLHQLQNRDDYFTSTWHYYTAAIQVVPRYYISFMIYVIALLFIGTIIYGIFGGSFATVARP
jgi:SMODS and SLOG-associating 2TM effector domain family 5